MDSGLKPAGMTLFANLNSYATFQGKCRAPVAFLNRYIDFLLCGSYYMFIVRFSLSLLLSGTLPVQAVAGVAKF